MPSREIMKYYHATKDRETRPDLVFAAGRVGDPKIAVDCGCGAGADIAFLLTKGFKVYGFDIEKDAIAICKERFGNNENVILSQSGFGSYRFPRASLVVADASLFFCPETEFADVWNNISACLVPDGIYCGSFLGPEDTMADSDHDNSALWSDVLVFDENAVRELFENYQICRFTEHRSSGMTPYGSSHEWHLFSVVARRTGSSVAPKQGCP